MSIYIIHNEGPCGKRLGTVEAASYFGAAVIAARRYFKGDLALRVSGWDGRAGCYRIVDPLDTTKFGAKFYIEQKP